MTGMALFAHNRATLSTLAEFSGGEAAQAVRRGIDGRSGLPDGGAFLIAGASIRTFHIKQGVDWNSSPPRQVTASDFVREFKAFFNPVSPAGNPGYYESTIFTAIQASRHHQSVAGRKLTQCRHPGWA